jgi:hypothetical protein
VVVLSGSGNDMRFGPLIADLVVDNVNSKRFELYSETAKQRMADFDAYQVPRLRASLHQLQGMDSVSPRQGYSIEQLLITEYPDPTPLVEDPKQTADFCNGHAFELDTGKFLTVTAAESQWAHENIVKPINQLVRTFATGINGMYVDGISKRFVNRGLCAKGGSDPYQAAGRLFRSPLDSLRLQGDKLGSFHPTWEGHAVYADRIEQSIRNSLSAKLQIELAESTKRTADGWIAGQIDISVSKNGANRINDKWCIESDSATSCIPASRPRIGKAHGEELALKLKVLDQDSARVWRRDFGKFRVDALPPTLGSCTVEAPGKQAQDCFSTHWISKASSLRIVARDQADGSGMDQLTVELESPPDAGNPKKIESFRSSPGLPDQITLKPELPAGVWDVRVDARDRVGNNSRLSMPQKLRIDQRSPELSAVQIYGADLKRIGHSRHIPSLAGDETEIAISAKDTMPGAGMRRTWFSFKKPSSPKPTDIPSSENGCDPSGLPNPDLVQYSRAPLFTTRDRADYGSLTFSAEDCAGNVSDPTEPLIVERVRPSTSPVAPAAVWTTQLQKDKELLSRIRLFTALFKDGSPPTDDGGWPVHAAWLNMVDGRVSPAEQIGSFPGEDCKFQEQQVSLYRFLVESERCLVDQPDAGVRAAFGIQVTAKLQGIALPK